MNASNEVRMEVSDEIQKNRIGGILSIKIRSSAGRCYIIARDHSGIACIMQDAEVLEFHSIGK